MTFFFEPGMASLTLNDDSLLSTPTVFETTTPMPHIVAELTGSFVIPNLSFGYISSWGLRASVYNATHTAGTVDTACTFVTGACFFTPSDVGTNYPTVAGSGWIMAGGSFIYEVKSLQDINGAYTALLTSMCIVSFEVSGGVVTINVQSALADAYRTSLMGSTVSYKLFAGFFS